MIKCNNCGRVLEDGSAFCDYCGRPVTVSAVGATDQQVTTNRQPAADQQPTTAQQAAVYGQTAAVQQTAAYQQAAAGQQAAAYQQPTGGQQAVNTFCTNCGAPLPAGAVFCEKCGTNAATGAEAGKTAPVKKKLPKGVLAIAALACVAAAGVGAFLFFSKGDKSSGIDYAYYIKDKEVFYTGPAAREPIQITDKLMAQSDIGNASLAGMSGQLGIYTVKSDTGNLIFFPGKLDYYDDGINLYYRQLTSVGKEAQKIDSDIMAYSVNDAATLVTYIKEDYSLYSYNLKKGEKEKISGDIDSYRVSDDGKRVYYLNDDEGLYMWTPEGGKEKIDSDVTRVCYNTDDFQTIYYLKEDSFYRRTVGGDKEKIASNVSHVIRVYESGAAYYIKDNSDDQSVYDFVYDDKAEEDLNLTEPVWPDYPSRSNYYSDSAYNAAVTAYNKTREEYDQKYEEYRQKLARDNMRNELSNDSSFYLERYELCYYDGTDEETITDELLGQYNYDASAESEVILCTAMDSKSFEKIGLSEFESVYDLKNNIMGKLQETSNRYAVVGKDANLIESEDGRYFSVSADGHSILFLDNVDDEKAEGDLYVIKISEGKVSSPELYDSDVYTGNLYSEADGHIRYFKDYGDVSGELYVDRKPADYDVYRYDIRYDGDSDRLYYYTDYNDSKEQGTLKVYADGKSEKIADDVKDFFAAGEDVYYLAEYSQKSYRGELYQYSGGQVRKIDDDVVGIAYAFIDREIQGGAYRFSWNW